jgi:selenocysteine-specific elongation factor
LLGAARVLPVITKASLADDSRILQTAGEVDRALAATALERFPVHVVDSITGRGIDELREAVFEACRSIARERAGVEALPYMPIDRSFVLKGVGTVVTGTLVRGALRVGESVEISSSPEAWRIRSLHNHKTQVETIDAGHRVGVHLHGVRAGASRGDILVSPGYPFRSNRVNAELELLPDRSFKPRHGTRALFLAASYEMECRLWGIREVAGRRWAQIQLPRESCFYPGQRFILRSTNPLATVGGGTVVDLVPGGLRRISDAELGFYRSGDVGEFVRDSAQPILEVGELEIRWMRTERSLGPVVDRIPGLRVCPARIGRHDETLVWDEKVFKRGRDVLAKLVEEAGNDEAEWPLSVLAARLGTQTVYVQPFLDECLRSGNIAVAGGDFQLGPNTLRFVPAREGLSEGERRVADDLVTRVRACGLHPERIAGHFEASGADRKMFDKVLARLVEDGRLVRIDADFVLDRETWTALRRGLLEFPASGVTPADFGKHFGLTRKFTMPYLECLNRSGLMRRDGGKHLVIRDRVERSLADLTGNQPP